MGPLERDLIRVGRSGSIAIGRGLAPDGVLGIPLGGHCFVTLRVLLSDLLLRGGDLGFRVGETYEGLSIGGAESGEGDLEPSAATELRSTWLKLDSVTSSGSCFRKYFLIFFTSPAGGLSLSSTTVTFFNLTTVFSVSTLDFFNARYSNPGMSALLNISNLFSVENSESRLEVASFDIRGRVEFDKELWYRKIVVNVAVAQIAKIPN